MILSDIRDYRRINLYPDARSCDSAWLESSIAACVVLLRTILDSRRKVVCCRGLSVPTFPPRAHRDIRLSQNSRLPSRRGENRSDEQASGRFSISSRYPAIPTLREGRAGQRFTQLGVRLASIANDALANFQRGQGVPRGEISPAFVGLGKESRDTVPICSRSAANRSPGDTPGY